MGNYSILIKATGSHKNGDPDIDADLKAVEFCKALQASGHTITSASFMSGRSMTPLFGPAETHPEVLPTSDVIDLATVNGNVLAVLDLLRTAVGEPPNGNKTKSTPPKKERGGKKEEAATPPPAEPAPAAEDESQVETQPSETAQPPPTEGQTPPSE